MPRSATLATLADATSLAIGTLTILPVPAPASLSRRVFGAGMLLAPLAVLPIGVFAAAAGGLVSVSGLGATTAALITVAVIALLTRALHLDGLADTADGLSSTGDRDAALTVMRRGDIGPSGVLALLLILGLQVSLLSTLWGYHRQHTAVWVVLAVAASRGVLAFACRNLPAARPEGLGAAVATTVPARGLIFTGLLLTVLLIIGLLFGLSALAILTGYLAAAGLATTVLTLAVVRFGGITGDVLGAAVELSFTGLLLGFTLIMH